MLNFSIAMRKPKINATALLLLVLLQGVLLPGGERRVAFPADLGPEKVDVSSYPSRMVEIYKNHFLTKCGVCHTPARAINSQFLELDERSLAEMKRQRPELLWDPMILFAGPDVWKIYIKKMKMRPPCCGACPVMTQGESRDIWEFLVYDSKERKTGAQAVAWQGQRRRLLSRYKEIQEERRSVPKERIP